MSLIRDTPVTVAPSLLGRDSTLDKARGLAVLLMVVDHVTLLLAGPELLRLTVGRLAMPLFFILAGHLVRRVGWRHYGIVGVGFVLPLLVPWVDSPNVLLWYVIGAGVLVVWRALRWSPWLLVCAALALAANGFQPAQFGTGYDGAQLVALMAAGAMIPRWGFAQAARLPRGLAAVGRYPLSAYVGHILVLEGVRRVFLT